MFIESSSSWSNQYLSPESGFAVMPLT